MKKALVVFIMFLILGFSFSCGYYLYKVPTFEKSEEISQEEKENIIHVVELGQEGRELL